MQTLEKGSANFSYFTKGVRIVRKSDLKTNTRGVNSVSGEKLHDFEIFCLARACEG